jgi:uncharacterized membrane protein
MKDIKDQFSRFIPDEKTPNEDRLVMLCDGVFAIAITLLVIDIGITPKTPAPSDVAAALSQLIMPGIFYLVTFLVIASYWRSHRNLMQVVQHLDNGFISLTFVFLAFIAFFPVTSKLLGDYADTPQVVIIYTLGLSGCSFASLALWLYATWKHRLVRPDLPPELINTRSISLLLNPLIYCASLLLLFVVPSDQPYLICFSWMLIGFTQRGTKYAYLHWLAKPVQELIHHEHAAAPSALPNQPELEATLPDTPVDSVEGVPAEAEQS